MIAHSYLIDKLDDLDPEQVERLATGAKCDLDDALASLPGARGFGILIIDGLSKMEERVSSLLNHHLGRLPLVGGSSGDDLRFDGTYVYHGGRNHRSSALLTTVATSIPFHLFKVDHMMPTEDRLVITKADQHARIVYEFNGVPAAAEYARILGVPLAELTDEDVAITPLLLKIGGEYYARSPVKINDDLSLTFACVIDEGLVLTVAQKGDVVQNTKELGQGVEAAIGEPEVVVTFECMGRRQEIDRYGLANEVSTEYVRRNAVGFNTYGEMYGGIHLNHTVTGVAFGGSQAKTQAA